MFQFPASPTVGQIFTPMTGVSYQWTGQGWTPYVTPDIFPPIYNGIGNGDFNIWQRGTSFPAINAGLQADRWAITAGTSAALATVDKGSGPPMTVAGNTRSLYNSLHAKVTTADAMAAGAIWAFYTRIEGYNWQPLYNRSSTLSFWVASSVPGQYSVTAWAPYNLVLPYTINAAMTWERKVLQVPASPLVGAWDLANGIGISILWSLQIGTTYQTPNTGVWLAPSPSYYGVAGHVNAMNAINNEFFLTGVQWEPGDLAHEFQALSYEQALIGCERYYQELNILGYSGFVGQAYASNAAYIPITYRRRMRAAPTVVLPAVGSGAGQATPVNNSANVPGVLGTVSASGPQDDSLYLVATGFTGAWAVGDAVMYYGSNGKIKLSADL